MGKAAMIQKNFRIPADLYEAAKAKAESQRENLSDIVRNALTQYVAKDQA